jgi:hypothetical protein
MLLNNDIKKMIQMILHFWKEINVIMYIIEITFMFFVMFKMKYLINIMQCNTLSQQVRWLDGRGVCLHPKGQTSQMVCLWSTMISWLNIFSCGSLK